MDSQSTATTGDISRICRTCKNPLGEGVRGNKCRKCARQAEKAKYRVRRSSAAPVVQKEEDPILRQLRQIHPSFGWYGFEPNPRYVVRGFPTQTHARQIIQKGVKHMRKGVFSLEKVDENYFNVAYLP